MLGIHFQMKDANVADLSVVKLSLNGCAARRASESGFYHDIHVVEAPINGGDPCDLLEDFEPCAEISCFGSDCKVSEWSEWGACSKECGGGVHTRERQVLMPSTGNGADCPELQQRRGCGLHRCPGVPCEDSPDVPLLTGVECKVLLAMGCHRRLQELAEENNQPFPEDLPPEVRVSDACPKTCGVCAECAPGCQLRDLGNRHCDEPCNNEACQMDLGDCGGDCALGQLPPGLRLEPATSMMTEGQTLIASCADPDMRLSPFSSMRQLAITCVGKGEFTLEPPDIPLKKDEEEALLLPPCAPDPCPFISVSGFTGDAAVFNGIFLRGDPHGSLPRFLQDTLNPPAHFLLTPTLLPRTQGSPQRQPAETVLRRQPEAMQPLGAQTAGKWASLGQKPPSGLTAAATGGDCAAETAGGDAAVGCTDSWEVGVAGTETTSKPQKATFKCIDEETRAELEAQQLGPEDSEEQQAVPQGPPVTVVAGVEMVCEDQQEVQEKSGKSCEALKKMLKCDFLLADAGVDLPSFLPPDATLALACPQTCGLCKQCARGCPLWFLGNRHCDQACNVAACQYDRGDCGSTGQAAAAPHQDAEATDEEDEEDFVALGPHEPQKKQQQQSEDDEEDEDDPATACEDDPQVKAMGFTCKVLYAVAEGTPEGCNSRLQDLRPDEALPPGVPPITRVKDACPKTCRACNDPDRLRRPGSRAADSASCQDDPMVTEMGYSCKLLLAVAEEEGEGCEARLIDLKPDQTLPPGIPHQTRVKDACPKTCNACDDPTRLQRPSHTPGAACTDFEFVGEAGSSCKLLLTLAQSQGLGGCSAPLSALLEEKHWPQGTPSDITLGDACPHTCDYCEGYTCRQIKDFLNGDCSVELESLSSTPLPPEVPKGATLRDACPYTCGACPAQQCVDNPMVQQMGYSCDMLIAAAEGRGGCEALLTSLSGEPLPAGVPPTTRVRDACLKSCNACPPLFTGAGGPEAAAAPGGAAAAPDCFDPQQRAEEGVPPTTRVRDACLKSCNACPPLFTGAGGPEAAAAPGGAAAAPDCFDDGRLPQLGYSCAMLLDFASKGCETTLGELLPQSLSLPRHLHRHDMIKDFCPKTHHLLAAGGAVDAAGRRRGCRNNPMVERAGLSCALLVKASPLGCNAKLADLSDDPLPPGVPPSATVRDACMLDCGGCIDVPTCFDGFQNGDEEGIDCGGRCRPCAPCDPSPLKALGEGVIQEGRGTAHGATRRLSCRAEFVRVAGRNGEEVICQDGTFSKPKLRCEPRSVTVQYIKAYIRNAGDLQYGAVPALFAALSSALRDLQYGAVPALFAALSSALRVQPPDELRLLAVGLDRRNDGTRPSGACEDDPRVAEMGYSCAMMEAFCDSKLHDLAAAQKKQLPDWLPKEAKVKDACRKTCGACDNRRRLQAVSGSPLSSLPLLIDAGVLWTRTAVPFSSLLTDDLPERFLSALKQQFIQRGVTLIDPTDKSLVSAAMALSSRPFTFAIESTEQRRLPIAHWEGGFGSYSPASHSKAVFAAAGLPIPSSQAVDLPHILDRDGRRPGPPSYASVDYSFGEAAPVHLPLPPGVNTLRGACFDPLSYRSDANSCCSLQEELQVFVDGPCGALLYGRRLTQETLAAFYNRRRLQAVSGSPLSSLPLLIDAGVLWTRTAVPFSSLLTDDLPERFLSALKQQFIQRGVTLIDPTDKSLVSAAMALSSRPFTFAIESTEQRRLPIAHWEGGFGSYSPASHSKAVFAAAGLPIPSSQAVDLPHILDRDGRRPGPPSYASVDYSFGEAAPVHLPLPPGVNTLRGACFDPLSYRSDANSCCSLQEELQVFVDGPCGALLYGRRLTQETLAAFCEKPVEGRYCWASFLSRVDAHKRRNGAACGLVQAVEAVLEAWCYKDPTSSPSRYCFAQVEDALEAADLRSLGSKTSSQLDEICGEKSCFRSNLRYLDNMTLLQTAWQILHAPTDEGRQGDVSPFAPEISRTFGRVPEAAAARRLQGGGTKGAGTFSQGFYEHTRRLLDARERAQHHMEAAVSAAAAFSGLHEQIEKTGRTPLERGPLTETLEEGLNLVCTKVENDYCQQTLVLLAQESPIRTPSLLLEPCASRCFVPLTGAVGAIVEAYGERYRDPWHSLLGSVMRAYGCFVPLTGAVGAIVEAYGERYRDPWHSLLGSVMRAYGRFYCVTNERGDFCGRHFFDRYRAANPHKVAAQGLELPLPDCQCPHSFLQDGQCDPECFNEACGWDGRDCLPSSMFAQLHAAVSSLVDPTCSLYHPDFECGGKCFKQYETARGVGGSGCCLGMGLDILGAVAAAEAAHPLGEIPWKVRRTVAFAEQICGTAADRTCSLGEPRPLLHVELRVVGLNSQVTLTDAGKVDEIFRALGTALTRKVGLVERDIARHFARPDPRGITVEFILDAGRDHAVRVAQLLRQPSLMKDVEAAALRQLGRVSLAAYLDLENGLLGVEFVPNSLQEEQITSPAAGLGPLPPKRGDEGLHELPLQLPPEPCTEASFASLSPQYAALERPKLSDKGDPEVVVVACSPGYLPTRGHMADSDRAICDNGKWVLEDGLDCRRTCTGRPDASLYPKGAYIVSGPDWGLNGRAAPRSLQASARHSPPMVNFGEATVTNATQGAAHGSALFVRCADGFAAGRGQEARETNIHLPSALSRVRAAGERLRSYRRGFTCHRLCPEFEQLGSAYVVTGEGQHQGDEREVSCSRGYYPQRRTHRLVCSEGSWPALPFRCSRAMTPDLREGVGGFQKILQQMFSREGILGFIAFSILVLAATLIVILCWLFCCRGRAHRRQRERAEALQALKLAVKSAGQEMVDLSRRIPARPPGDAVVPPPSEAAPTGRSSQRDPDESTPVPEWLAEERILPAQAVRRATDPRCYSAAPTTLTSLSSTPGSSIPCINSGNNREPNQSHQAVPLPRMAHEVSSEGTDAEVELMHSREEEEAIASLREAAAAKNTEQNDATPN
ncbi:LOW QUALITY PROTEIN: uncharacterized protein EMH_0007840 [Eimeria mitis]|uniref:LNR domain-containing protein n=1 Tax=Eimeria mitis TaxID=44415 RepID=U6K6D0_9EIME|nr:LOW QUALITY PROTEIN: uncharacterized protein EMH_0007840 [Eimeria mitis]CDJ31038.1 hypothetical protein EMH_0007840 [Eimeria mitis]